MTVTSRHADPGRRTAGTGAPRAGRWKALFPLGAIALGLLLAAGVAGCAGQGSEDASSKPVNSGYDPSKQGPGERGSGGGLPGAPGTTGGAATGGAPATGQTGAAPGTK